MLQSYTYLLINIFTIIICLISSFDKRVKFYKHFGTFLCAATIVAIPFIIWDIWFTQKGVWWFDLNYTLGITLAGLPLEECLFFFCIPFSCIFTYFCVDTFFNINWANAYNNIIVFVFLILFTVLAFLHIDKLYTFIATLITIITLIYLHFFAAKEWIGKATLVYLILIPGFLIVNGVLTGTGIDSPIVNYNPNEFMGVRILTIPVEDVIYGYSLFLLNIYFFKMFQKIKANLAK